MISRILCAFAILCAVCLPPGSAATSGSSVALKMDRDVAYGRASSKQKLDILYRTDVTPPRPAVIYVHGGGWSGGDKDDDPQMQGDMMTRLADGFVAVAINYRLADEVKFPAAVEDCKLAVRWLRAHAAQYGIDKNRIGVVGGSAGGHLAAMLAVTQENDGFEGSGGLFEESSAVQAVVSVSGPTDLQEPLCATQVESRRKMVSDFLGVPDNEFSAAAKKASPISYVRKDAPPMLLVHCRDDQSIDAGQSIRFADAMKKVGAPVELLLLDGANHGSEMARTDPVLSQIITFLRATLKPEQTAR